MVLETVKFLLLAIRTSRLGSLGSGPSFPLMASRSASKLPGNLPWKMRNLDLNLPLVFDAVLRERRAHRIRARREPAGGRPRAEPVAPRLTGQAIRPYAVGNGTNTESRGARACRLAPTTAAPSVRVRNRRNDRTDRDDSGVIVSQQS
jgi:hypothetical protein